MRGRQMQYIRWNVRACDRSRRLLAPLVDQGDDLALVGETVKALFGEDQLTVKGDLEDAAAGRLQVEVLDLASVGVYQVFRQTDGIRQVVSHGAELYGDVHYAPFLSRTVYRLV